MAKTCRKTILAIFLTLCLALFCGALVACDGDVNNDSLTYTVTVLKDDSTPAQGVGVEIKKGTATLNDKSTGADGKVSFTLAPDEYNVELYNLPAGYVAPESGMTLTKQNPDLVVNISRDGYIVKFVHENGDPFYMDGVYVAVCELSGSCHTPVLLGKDGIAVLLEKPDDYHVKITEMPEGYYYEQDAEGYYTGKNFSATDKEMTIVMYPMQTVDFETSPMTDAEKSDYAKPSNGIHGFKTANPAFMLSKTLKAGELMYYKLQPTITGQYSFYHTIGNYYYNDVEFAGGAEGSALAQYHNLEAGKTYFIKVENIDNKTVTTNLVVSAPLSSYVVHRGVGGTATVTVGEENTNATIEFIPTQAGAYKLTVQGNTPASITQSKYAPDEIIRTPLDDSAYKVGGGLDPIKYTPDMLGSALYFAVTTKSAPNTLEVKVEKLNSLEDTTNVVEVKAANEKFADATEGTELYGVPMDGTAALEFNAADGYYYYNGKVVVVMLTNTVDENRFAAESALAYMDIEPRAGINYVIDVTTDADKLDNTKGNIFNDYRMFLRGFDKYDEEQGMQGINYVIPKNIKTEKYYVKYANSDGVYPLTQELKDYLEEFFAYNLAKSSTFNFWNNDREVNGREWLAYCFYYDTATPADPIVGRHSIVSLTDLDDNNTVYTVGSDYNENKQFGSSCTDGKITKDTIIIEITKNGRFYVYQYMATTEEWDEENPLESGSWSVDNGVYTFVCNNNTSTITASDNTLVYEDSFFLFKVTFALSPDIAE